MEKDLELLLHPVILDISIDTSSGIDVGTDDEDETQWGGGDIG